MTDYQEQSNSNSRKPLYLALIGVLLLINGLLIYSNIKLKNSNKEQVTTLTEEKSQLQADYDNLLQELESYKSQNQVLDSTANARLQEIETRKAEVEQVLRKSNASKAELAQARTSLASLRTEVDSYKQRITELEQANTQLTAQNVGLQDDKRKQQDTISGLRTDKTTLTQEKETLTEEKEQLSKTKEDLTRTKNELTTRVNRANAVVKAANISAEAVRLRKNGKEVSTKNNKRVDELKVCFDMTSNSATQPGEKEIMVRITNPKGEVLSVQELGGGIFTNEQTGEDMQYTQKGYVNYSGNGGKACINCKHNAAFDEGSYKIELYNDGYYIGAGQVMLK